MIINAETFKQAMTDPQKRQEMQLWLEQDKKSQKPDTSEVGPSHPSKRDRKSSQYAGAYPKAPPMTTIQEKETKKRITDTHGLRERAVAHREGTLTKLTNHIESAKQKAGKTLISEIPTDQWLKNTQRR